MMTHEDDWTPAPPFQNEGEGSGPCEPMHPADEEVPASGGDMASEAGPSAEVEEPSISGEEPEPCPSSLDDDLLQRFEEGVEGLRELICDTRDLLSETAGKVATSEQAATMESELVALKELFTQRVSRTEYEEKTLRLLTEEVERHRAGLYDQIMTPLLLKVIEVADNIGSTLEFARKQDDPDGSIGVSDLEIYHDMLVETLEDYSVRPFTPEVGDTFDSSRFRRVGLVPTGDRSLYRRVAEVRSHGYELNGRVIAPAAVKAYQFQEGREESADQSQDVGSKKNK